MQEMLSTVNIPVNGGAWFRGAHYADDPVRVTYDRRFDTALTDSAKQAALQNMSKNTDMSNRTWPMAEHVPINRVNVVIDGHTRDVDDEDVFSSPRSRNSSDAYWLRETNPESSNSTMQRHIEVVEHNINRTTHILKPNTRLLSDDATDDEAETENDEDQHNFTWNSDMTEPEPISELTDTKEGETQTPRHRKTQTPEYAFTQTPRGHRKLPTIPGLEPVNGEIDIEGDEGDHQTNPSLMRTHIAHREHSPDIGSISLQETNNVAQQPEYLRDYQKYIESFDGTASGPFVVATPHDKCDGGHTKLQQAQDRRTQQQGDNVLMPNTNRLNNAVPRDSTAGALAANNNNNVLKSQSLYAMQNGSDTKTSIDLREKQSFVSLANSRPNSAQGRLIEGRQQSGQVGYIPGRATPLAQQVLHRTFPISGESHAHRYAWNTLDDRRDFSQQTMKTSSTQTPLKIRLSNGSSALGDSIVIDSDGYGHAVSLGLEPWTLLGPSDLDIQKSHDFSTQTFGQWYDNYYSHTGTQTQVSGHYAQDTCAVDSTTQTLNDNGTQTTPIAELLLSERSGLPMRQPVPINPQQAVFGPNSLHGFQAGMYPRVSVAPPQSTVNEEDEQLELMASSGRGRLSRKDKHKAKKDRKKKERSRERSNDRETEDNQSVMTSQTNMSRRDILKYMLKQVKDLKEKLDPDLVAAGKEAKKKSKQKEKNKSKIKSKKKAHDDDSAIESFGEDGEMDDKLYSRRRLELLYSRPHDVSGAATDYEARTFRRQRRHSVESLHSDKGDDRDDSRDRAYDRLREKYIPRSRQSRKTYTPPPRLREYSPPYSHGPPIYPNTRGRSPVRQPPSRHVLPPHMAQRRAGYSPQVTQPWLFYPPHSQTPQHMQPMTPQHQYMSPQLPTAQISTPVIPGQGFFRPISTQPQQITPVQGTPMLVVQNEPTVQQSPHPSYIVLASPAKYESANEGESRERKGHRSRPASAQAAFRGNSLDQSFSKVTQAAREMKSLTRRMTHLQ